MGSIGLHAGVVGRAMALASMAFSKLIWRSFVDC